MDKEISDDTVVYINSSTSDPELSASTTQDKVVEIFIRQKGITLKQPSVRCNNCASVQFIYRMLLEMILAKENNQLIHDKHVHLGAAVEKF